MNHGGMAFLTQDGIYLPPDIVRPISGRHKSTFVGFYYPVELSPQNENHPDVKHDLMITPVPTRYWPCSARVVVRIRHAPGAAQHVAQRIKELGWTILNAECTRSAYGYATWYMSVAYEEYRLEPCPGKEQHAIRCVDDMSNRLDELKANLLNSCQNWLFTKRASDLDPSFREPVTTRAAGALSYFHSKVCESLGADPYSPQTRGTFTLTLDRSNLARGDDRFKAVVQSEFGRLFEGNDALVCLAEMDSVSCNVRVAILTPELEKQFVHAVMSYRRVSPRNSRSQQTSKGLLAAVLAELENVMDMYRIANLTLSDEMHEESGTYHFLGKLLDDASIEDIAARIKRTKVKSVDPGIVIGPPEVRRLSDRKFRQYSQFVGASASSEPTKDVFVSHSRKEKDEPGFSSILEELKKQGIEFDSDQNNRDGEEFGPEIFNKIRHCRFLLLFATKLSLKSNWVHAELGAAQGLGKKIFVICDDATTRDEALQTVSYLRNIGVGTWSNREKTVRDIAAELGEPMF